MPLTQVSTGMIADSAVTPAKLSNSGNELGMRNRIINGDGRVDQRNAGASTTPSADATYFVDRWSARMTQASKYSVQQNAGAVTPPAGFNSYIGITSTSAYSVLTGDVFTIDQKIEGFNVADLQWGTANAQPVTLSFYVRSSLTGTFGGAVQNSAQNRCYPFSYTISSANTWEQKSITIPGDTTGTWLKDNGLGMFLKFGLGAGATYSGTAGAWTASYISTVTGAVSVVGTNAATWYITGLQLEKGSVATPFEFRPYGQELALCQRYYERLNYTDLGSWTSGMLSASNAISQFIPWKVTKRGTTTGGRSAANAVNLYSGGTVTSTAVTNNASPAGFALDITIGSTISTFSAVYSWPNSSWFDGSAEL